MSPSRVPSSKLRKGPKRGRLQIWLGYSAGIGKTFTMLSTTHRLLERKEDAVVGYVETHGRERVRALLKGLEVVPRKSMVYRGAEFEEMDLDAVLARKPEWAIVDELAHTNVAGSRNEKRWQDIEELLAAGISVLSTVNIQHLESLNDTVERITGVKQRETVPDAVVRAADQIDLVDVAPDALRRRLARGDIYPSEKVDAALSNYFREGNLTALRELALLWLADRVDEELLDYMDRYEIRGTWETRERIVASVSGKEADMHLVRRAARMADRRSGDFLVLHVLSDDRRATTGPQIAALAELTADLGGTFREVSGGDIAESLLSFARAENATQLVVGASSRSGWDHLLHGSVINKVVRGSGQIDVHVISQEGPSGETPLRRRRARPVALRRQEVGVGVGVAGLIVLTLVLTQFRSHVGLPTVFLLYLCLVVAVSAIGGWWPAVGVAVASSLVVNWYFTPPIHTWTIAEPSNVFALVVFIIVAAVVSRLVSLEARNRLEAARGRAEADALARLAGSLTDELDPLPVLLKHLQESFHLESVSVLIRTDNGWRPEASVGLEPPLVPGDATFVAGLAEDAVLAARGSEMSADDQRIVSAFVAQLSAAVRNRKLVSEAASATQLASLNDLRAAILNAVSHDLRTPLASIKASVSSLRQKDVQWGEDETEEFLEAIEDETDRLDWLVGNILDMSRLQADAVSIILTSVGLDEVVPKAVRTLPEGSDKVIIDVPETLSRVRADPALLERAVANLLDNALAWSPAATNVRAQASEAAGRVELRVVDKGPGIPNEEREKVFQPFQRLGDRPREGGVGLGLAVARGLVEAMDGKIDFEDTPGGGLTVVLSLEAVKA